MKLIFVLALAACGDTTYAGLPPEGMRTCVMTDDRVKECVVDGALYRCVCNRNAFATCQCAKVGAK